MYYLCGTKYLNRMTQTQKEIILELYNKNYNVNCTIRKTKPNMYCVGVYGKRQVEKVLNILYLNANTYLERKYNKAMLNSNV